MSGGDRSPWGERCRLRDRGRWERGDSHLRASTGPLRGPVCGRRLGWHTFLPTGHLFCGLRRCGVGCSAHGVISGDPVVSTRHRRARERGCPTLKRTHSHGGPPKGPRADRRFFKQASKQANKQTQNCLEVLTGPARCGPGDPPASPTTTTTGATSIHRHEGQIQDSPRGTGPNPFPIPL